MLIAAEFLPVSLLTPIAVDLHGRQGTAGQAISISGLFGVAASLLIPVIGSRFDRRHVLLALTAVMLARRQAEPLPDQIEGNQRHE